MVNSFQEIRAETNLFPDYILDDTSDNDNLNGDKSINDMDDDENYINDNNGIVIVITLMIIMMMLIITILIMIMVIR